jgi:thymidylate synthase (FAD)
MQTQLISLTKPAMPDIEDFTAEELIVYTARASNPSNQMNTATAADLLGYCIRNKHWSPFEMANMCVEIKTSRAIAAQILRHRSFSFQEFSQRYAEVTKIEPVQLRLQAEKNRQSSTEEINNGYLNSLVEDTIQHCERAYATLLNEGIARECARMVLPMTTQTTMYMNGTIRSWIHYLQQRCDEHAQLEHQDIAREIQQIFIHEFPEISKALGWRKYGL